MTKPSITICSSVSFYRQAGQIRNQLVEAGYEVLLPDVAEKMVASGDYEVEHYKTWFANPDDYHKKGELMHGHFDKVVKGDVTLVLNYEKHGQANYIGGNVLMEMGIAFHFKKPIFILNGLPQESPFEEEILGLQTVFLKGDLSQLTVHLEASAAVSTI